MFDQDAENITDDVAATVEKNGTLNVFATAAVAPYITAPTTVTLDNPVATNPAYKVTLKNANGDAYEQLNSASNTANNTSKVTVYTSAKKAVGNTLGNGSDYVKGVAVIAGSAAVSGIKYYAEWVGEKGI